MHNKVINCLKILSILGGIFCLIAMGCALFVFFQNIASSPENFKSWLNQFGGFGKVALVIMMSLQVLVAFLPGEIIELGAGIAYGTFEGLFLCLLGAAIGSYIILRLVRKYGVTITEYFISKKKINQLGFLNDESKMSKLVFILFFIPGTPKDIITYFAGLTTVKIWRFIGLTTVARIPSVISSTFAGEYVMKQEFLMAALVYGATLVLSIAGYCVYRKMTKTKKEEIVNEG